ncbi:DNA polymerase III subunit gamma/tau [Planomicrobium sp. CPCC 101110]|uniref:DNA polymerase III subunit gamma/tau n=1 Tax=Planomicrobium sp. CPCC 101110 TaxID=2599619 RepID=UPI0011B47A39|nr:DNA polymerase III subunit gamma/tau [Planomicrobium sp. CPCC 101110]TWT23895.1 DNA polymerase III subunit gamma/tau [Planomicrobium sp. CPCC 101110]
MAYQAFYRVYRPQTFSEMTGQSHIKQTLQNALLYNKTTHAYLFSGPRGTGKTSTAKIFAKALNCEQAPVAEPCNECDSCKSINAGSNTDVIEFDAASNSRVEEMREIIEKVRFSPANSRFKIYIIDEVHMLSNSAFNALLKTLEEPPEHVVFILATTEPHKLPLTIISRCQRFDFKSHTQVDLVKRMVEVLTDAQIPYNEQVLKIIAQAAAGGMRDALSLLDQVVSFSGDEMTIDDALLVTGSISQDMFYSIAEALLAKDIGQALSLLEQLIRDGKDPVRLVEDFITFFRDLLLIQTAPDLHDMLELASHEARFEELAKQFEAATLYDWIDILTKTQQEMRFSNHTKIYMETALLKMVQADAPIRPSSASAASPELEAKVTQLEQLVRELQHQLKNGAVASPAAAPVEQKRRQSPQNGFKVPVGRIQDVLKNATKPDIQAIKTNWATVMAQLQRSHAALLNEAEPVAASADAFVLKFKYDIHCQMASENQSFAAVFSQLLEQYTGKAYSPVFVPDANWLKIREDFIKSSGLKAGSEEKQGSPEEEHPFSADGEASQEDPFITEAERLFGKDFVEIHEE